MGWGEGLQLLLGHPAVTEGPIFLEKGHVHGVVTYSSMNYPLSAW